VPGGAHCGSSKWEEERVALVSGLNHVAVLTADLDRFIHFYTRVFGLEVIFSERTPGLSHAILKISTNSWLHPAELPSNPYADGLGTMFQRGHLDHLSLTASSTEAFEQLRSRLIEARASDGRVDDLGSFRTLWFVDPDGMRGEVALIVDPSLSKIHDPRPIN
jgi:catechol 2,3-dioxygenase-like lactoylglutathione lyase family enzyme